MTILRMDTLPKVGVVVHVSFAGVRVKNPDRPEGYSSVISHAPFAESAVQKSVTRLVREHVPLPDFEEGYNTWRAAYDGGTGGVFTISLAEAVEFMERALTQ